MNKLAHRSPLRGAVGHVGDIFESAVRCEFLETEYDPIEDAHHEVWNAWQEGAEAPVLFRVRAPSRSRWDVLHALAEHPKMRGSGLAQLSARLLSGDRPLLDSAPAERLERGELIEALRRAAA